MWEGLKNYAEGNFYEPRFYGQAYNTFLEALLAVPLYWGGMPAYMALPLVTTIISITPFIVLSLFTFLKRSVFFGLVIISVPLLLPTEYAMITSMPRGFITGIFIAGFGCIALFYEKSEWSFFLSGLIALVALTVNSNAILISIPCLFYLLLNNKKKKQFYKFMGAGLLLGAFIHFLFAYFYITHPFYDLHRIVLEYSLKNLFSSFNNLDIFLNFNAPVFWHQGYLVLFVFLGTGIYFFAKKEYNKALPVLIIPFLFLLTLGFNKVHEGNESIFFHCSRMYLSVPLLLCFCFSLFNSQREFSLYYFWLYLPYTYYNIHIENLSYTIVKRVKSTASHAVIISKVEPILADCKRLGAICRQHNVDLFVIVNHFYFDAYASGCAACEADFPKTLQSRYERRTWRLLEDENKIYKTVMFIDINNHIADGHTFIKKIPGTLDLYLVNNNTMKTMKLLDTLYVKYRPFR